MNAMEKEVYIYSKTTQINIHEKCMYLYSYSACYCFPWQCYYSHRCEARRTLAHLPLHSRKHFSPPGNPDLQIFTHAVVPPHILVGGSPLPPLPPPLHDYLYVKHTIWLSSGSVLFRIFGLGGKLWGMLSLSRVGGSGGILPQKGLNFTSPEMQSSAFI